MDSRFKVSTFHLTEKPLTHLTTRQTLSMLYVDGIAENQAPSFFQIRNINIHSFNIYSLRVYNVPGLRI